MKSVAKKPVMICIAGFSGGGKSTMSKIMQTLLPDAYAINGDNFMFEAIIQFPQEAEKIFGVPVDTDNGKNYLIRHASPTNVDSENKFIKLARPYVEEMFEKTIASTIETHSPKFIILEWGCSPILKLWHEVQYRIKVEPTDWELLFEAMKKRTNLDSNIAKEIAEVRRLAASEFIEDAVNVDYKMKNNYDEQFKQDIKKLCAELMKNNCN